MAYYCNSNNYKIPYQSSINDVKYGVPQGSILGPLLFIYYLSDLAQLSNLSKLCLYADDTNLKITASTNSEVEIRANSDLILLNQFFNSRNLLLNSDKTNFINFVIRKNNNQIQPKIMVHNLKLLKAKKT